MDIGKKIKQLRIQKGLTLDELAKRCELTKGFLSQLERNLTSPSIQTIEYVTEALGTDLSNFFKKEVDKQIVFKKEDSFTDIQDDFITDWIVPNAQKNLMEPTIVELLPYKNSTTISIHDGEEMGYVLNGRVKLVIGENELLVKKGETFYIDGSKEHYIKNVSNSNAKILWISTPPIF